MEKLIKILAERATDTHNEPIHALQLTQAACNLANALRVLADIPKEKHNAN